MAFLTVPRMLKLNADTLDILKESPTYYFPSLPMIDWLKVLKPFNPSANQYTQNEIKDIKKAINFPGFVAWSVPQRTRASSPTHLSNQYKKWNAILALSTITCLFFRRWMPQALATHRAGKMILNTALIMNVIGLTYLGIKSYLSRNPSQNDSSPQPVSTSCQEELEALRFIQYCSFMYDQLCTRHPGGRPYDCIIVCQRHSDWMPLFASPPNHTGELPFRVFNPKEFKANFASHTFQAHYRNMLERHSFHWLTQV